MSAGCVFEDIFSMLSPTHDVPNLNSVFSDLTNAASRVANFVASGTQISLPDETASKVREELCRREIENLLNVL